MEKRNKLDELQDFKNFKYGNESAGIMVAISIFAGWLLYEGNQLFSGPVGMWSISFFGVFYITLRQAANGSGEPDHKRKRNRMICTALALLQCIGFSIAIIRIFTIKDFSYFTIVNESGQLNGQFYTLFYTFAIVTETILYWKIRHLEV